MNARERMMAYVESTGRRTDLEVDGWGTFLLDAYVMHLVFTANPAVAADFAALYEEVTDLTDDEISERFRRLRAKYGDILGDIYQTRHYS